MPKNHKPSAADIVWLVGFFAGAAGSAWSIYAKPGGWIEVAITAYVVTFMFGSGIWHLVSVLKAERAKQLAVRARLKTFNDENRARRST